MTALGACFRFGENEEDDDLIGEYATPQDKEKIVSSTFKVASFQALPLLSGESLGTRLPSTLRT